jgi:hypothetical protein
VSIFAVALMPAVGKAISNASAFYGTIESFFTPS